ncbi:hypothetical protein KM043_015483 [Ampulex compressa]|nr:hypothetical protein KM043_015483 [Ampulex compressa]
MEFTLRRLVASGWFVPPPPTVFDLFYLRRRSAPSVATRGDPDPRNMPLDNRGWDLLGNLHYPNQRRRIDEGPLSQHSRVWMWQAGGCCRCY